MNSSKMEFKHVNPNGEIIVANNLYAMNLFILKICKNWVQQQIIYHIFQEDALIEWLPMRKKTYHNFHMTNSNWIK